MVTRIFGPSGNGCVLALTGLPGGGDRIYDRSQFGNHGHVSGSVWVRRRLDLWCPSFDGVDDYVDVAPTPEINITTGDITIAMWFRADAVDRTCDLLQKGVGGGSYTIHCDGSNRIVFLKQADAASQAVSTTQIQAGKWYFVVGQKKAGTGLLFIDGRLEGTDGTFANFTSKTNLYIGKGDDGKFAGQIALLRIYNRALSALEVQNLYRVEKSLFGMC